MSAWTHDELDKIGKAEELVIQSERSDGSLRNPVTIWVVRVDDALYVRGVKGRSGWFRGTQTRHAGRIRAGGVNKKVIFEDADAKVSDQIDSAYQNKYRHYGASIVESTLTPAARDATLKLLPL